jgi:hypothetical protein
MDWDGTVVGVVAGMLLAWKWEFPSALISLFALGAFAAVVHMQNRGPRHCGNSQHSVPSGLEAPARPFHADFDDGVTFPSALINAKP